MTKEDIDNIISIICPNDEDFEKPIISPAYLKNELETLALEQKPSEDAIKYFNTIYRLSQTCGVTYDFIFDRVQEIETMIKTLPPVPLQPKMGQWIKKEHEICFTCNRCWVTNASGTKYNYCPNCGAKMEAKET